jgi:hypothetical protein
MKATIKFDDHDAVKVMSAGMPTIPTLDYYDMWLGGVFVTMPSEMFERLATAMEAARLVRIKQYNKLVEEGRVP